MTDWIGRICNSIAFKIMSIIILSIIPLNLLVIVSTSQSVATLTQQTQTTLKSVADLSARQLDSRIFSAGYFLFDLQENNVDFREISRQKSDNAYFLAKASLARRFASHIESGEGADGYFLRARDIGDVMLILPVGSVPGGIKSAGRVRESLAQWFASPELEISGNWALIEAGGEPLLIRIYQSEGVFYGAVFSLAAIQRGMERATGFADQRVLIDTQPAFESPEIVASAALTRATLSIHVIVPRSAVMRSLPAMLWLSVFLAFAYLALIPFLLFMLNRTLLRPLGGIRAAILHLKEGDRHYRIAPRKSAEEFRQIGQAFNEMADSIVELKLENYEKELARQNMELRNLQLQIHPHFLLNMHNLIYSLAQTGDFSHVQKVTLYLSNYFRYIFRSEKPLEPFLLELSLIREYLDISALRYPDRFTVQYDIEDSALDVEVPPLLIHNLVENIFKHALKPGETIHIRLSASLADGWGLFSIQDSGAGMDPQTAQRINNGDFSDIQKGYEHIGLANTNQRLRYFFGEGGQLRVAASPGEGTEFTVRLPLKKVEEDIL